MMGFPLLRAAALALILAVQPAIAAPETGTARAAHDSMIVLDTHFDTPFRLGVEGWTILDRHDHAATGDQVDLPRMIEGGVDGGFFVVFTAQGPRTPEGHAVARDAALVRAVQVREMIAKHSDQFALAITAGDAPRILADGRRFAYLSIENGHPFAADLTLVRSFRALGVTMMGPVHFLNNDLADSSSDPAGLEWGGLSAQGRAFVAEANRLGVLLDASHAHDLVLDQMLALSSAPIILSHSGCRAVFDHPRNIDDDRLRALAAKGGVIQINAFSAYMVAIPTIAEREAALKALGERARLPEALTEAGRRAIMAERRSIDAQWPVPRAGFADLMKHVLHAIRVAGIDHVGISGDFDGGGGIEGFEDVSAFPRLTAALLAAGYSEADVAKVMGGNALRVLGQAQALADPGAVPAAPPVTH